MGSLALDRRITDHSCRGIETIVWYQFWNADDHSLVARFLRASTAALPTVKMEISVQIAVALMGMMGMVSRKQNRNQTPIIAVGTLITIHNSFHA